MDVGGQITKIGEPEPEPAAAPAGRGAAARQAGGRAAPAAVKPKVATVALEPGETVTVRTAFQATLSLSKGLFHLALPALYPGKDAREKLFDLGPVGVEVRIHHDEPLAHAKSPTHEIYTDYQGDMTRIQLADGLEGRDFELEFAVGAEDDPSLVGYVGREHDGGREVLAVLTPPSKPRAGSARPKEMLFVLDTSGSMAKDKLEQARAALIATLQKLNADDLYNIVEFDAQFTMFREEPVEVSQVPVDQAAAWLRQQRAGGGTKLLPALLATFAQDQDESRHNMIIILTDGNVQDPREVEQLLQQKLGHARLFILGIGEDVNPANIGRFADVGRGTAVLSREADSLDAVLASLFESIAEPLAWDLEIDWGGADVELVQPTKLPDLYAGRSVTVVGRVRGPAPEKIEIRSTTMDGQRVFSTRLPEAEVDQLESLVPEKPKAPRKR